ncbi:MAG: hypothetical protein M3357_02500 [Actinomycetota bacterium]|nr:hypothetical protein [Actinomycetota bacterium]
MAKLAPPARRTLLVVGALVATGALVSGIAMTRGGGTSEVAGHYEQRPGSEPADVTRFFEVMRLAFTGVLADAATFDERVAEVASGSRPPEELTAALDASLRRAEGTRDLVGASADLPGLPQARQLYLRSALLYAEALWALRAGVESDDHGRAELVVQARRLKLLSNRVYDRGTVVADPALPVIRETPDWQREGLLPGRGADVREGWGQTLSAFTAAVRPRVAPPTHYEPSLARMAVLVDDEAAAAFSVASTTTSGPLRDRHEARARRLALLGEDLWGAAPERRGGTGLPDHPRSGFDRSGLEPRPVPGIGSDGLGSR